MNPPLFLALAIRPTLAYLAEKYAVKSDERADVMLLAMAQQESLLAHRAQLGGGPARGFFQFERGTEKTRGGVTGIFLHPTSRDKLRGVCGDLCIPFDALSIWRAVETNDHLAVAAARLLLLTDPRALPGVHDALASWEYYKRVWNPGKPHPETWPGFHAVALATVNANPR